MVTFFKGLLKGLLYILFFPIGLLGICLYAVFGIFVFIYRLIKITILFFTGRNLKTELQEDEEVKKILEVNKEETKQDTVEPVLNIYPSDQEMYNVDNYISPTFEDKKEEETKTEELNNND